MKEDTVKMFLAAGAAAVWSYAKTIFWPCAVLTAVMAVDWATGVAAAWVHDELSSRVGLIGALKKLGYLAMVLVGCVIDYMISLLGSQLGGETFELRAIGLMVVCWLIVNELISILENVARQGGPVPPFLRDLLSHLKKTAEKQLPEWSESDTQPEGKHERRD